VVGYVESFAVRGDGTPAVDVKPYYPAYDRVGNAAVPEWVDRLMAGCF
jgi:tRNA (Thr-GGU) A37 N-methylase